MQSEIFGNLFTEININKMASTSTGSIMSEMTTEQAAELASYFSESLTPPGHMQKDVARAYMARVVQLFGESEMKVAIAVAGWSAVHDVGNVQDFAAKPPIVCGSKVVPATAVFGDIIPVSMLGEPRQWCATMFEADVDKVLMVMPQVKTILAARCAEAGLPSSDPKAVITWVKGVTTNTAGNGVARVQAKHNLLARNANSAGGAGAAKVASSAVREAVVEAPISSGHNLY